MCVCVCVCACLCVTTKRFLRHIAGRTTNVAKAIYSLRASYRWCLSGTPLQNNVGELYGLVKFLKMEPWAYYCCNMQGCDCKFMWWQFVRGVCSPQTRHGVVSVEIQADTCSFQAINSVCRRQVRRARSVWRAATDRSCTSRISTETSSSRYQTTGSLAPAAMQCCGFGTRCCTKSSCAGQR